MKRLERGLWAAATHVKNFGGDYGFRIDRIEWEIEILGRSDFSTRADDILARYTAKGAR